MERGLIWLPLLALFFWLAWAGWNEYQKVEAYRLWAAQFERAKYDIYAVLGQTGSQLTWGMPTRQGPVDLQTVSLQTIESIQFWVNDKPADLTAPPARGRAVLELVRSQPNESVRIPFTDPDLAAKWGRIWQQEIPLKNE
jgi:hypothetical protein